MLRVGEEGRGLAPGYCIDDPTLNIDGEGDGTCANEGNEGGGYALAPGLDAWRASAVGAACDGCVGVWEVGVDAAEAVLVVVLIAGVLELELLCLWCEVVGRVWIGPWYGWPSSPAAKVRAEQKPSDDVMRSIEPSFDLRTDINNQS